MNSLRNYHSCHQWITVEFSGIMTHPNFNSVDLFHFYLHATAQNFNSFHSILPINFHYELTCESSYYSLQHRIFTTHKQSMISWHIRNKSARRFNFDNNFLKSYLGHCAQLQAQRNPCFLNGLELIDLYCIVRMLIQPFPSTNCHFSEELGHHWKLH